MDTTSPQRDRSARVRKTAPLSVEALLARLAGLVAERQGLHASAASAAALERNRRAIVHAQWELSHALIDRYGARQEQAA